jgi:hypothetical protein
MEKVSEFLPQQMEITSTRPSEQTVFIRNRLNLVARKADEGEVVKLPVPILTPEGGHEKTEWLPVDNQFVFGMLCIFKSKELQNE